MSTQQLNPEPAMTNKDMPPEQQTMTLQQAVELGVQHQTAGRLSEAESIYQQILQTKPEHPVALHLLGVIAHQVGKNDIAVDLISKAVGILPDYAEAHTNLGNALNELGRFDAAITSYQNAIAINPDYAMAHNNLGNAFNGLEQLDEAIACCQKALAIDPNLAMAHNNLGNALHKLGRINEAIACYHKALVIDPGFAMAHNNLGNVLNEQGRTDEALDCCRKALAIDPDFAMAHNNLGNVFSKLERSDEAVASYQKATTIKPDFPEALNNLGAELNKLGRSEEGIACYNKALAIDPNFATAYNNLGNALNELGRSEEAVASCRKAITINPDFALAHNNMGNALNKLGRSDEAIICYQKTLSIKPDFALAHNNMGNALNELGRPEEAIVSCHKALEINPDFAMAYNNLGNAYLILGRPDEAITSCNRAITINPEYTEAYNNLGNALNELGRSEEAIACYLKALAINPKRAEAHNNLGVVFNELGRSDDAVASYQKALSLKPDYTEVFDNMWFALRPMCYGFEPDSKEILNIEQIINTLPTPPESDIIRYHFSSLFDDNTPKAWQNIKDNLPPTQDETSYNPTNDFNPPTTCLENAYGKRITALLHFGRSGTGYLHSLLDNHPEISTMPGIYMSGFVGRKVWNSLAREGFSEIPNHFSHLYKVLFNARLPDSIPPAFVSDIYSTKSVGQAEGFVQMGESRDTPLSLERDQFLENLSNITKHLDDIDHGQLFEAIHHAFEKTLGTNFENKRLIFYHLHKNDPYAMSNFLRYFPSAQILMIIRNPLESCESWAQKFSVSKQSNGYKMYESLVNRIIPMLMDLNSPIFHNQNSAAICLEDLKAKPIETMRRLCAFLDIEDAPSLYRSTMQGLKWWGDPSSKLYGRTHDMESWDDDPVRDKTSTLFSTRDQLIMGTLFYPLSARFGYVETNASQFSKDLKAVYPLLNEPLDFEEKLAKSFPPGHPELEKTASFKSFHVILNALWRILDEQGTYPNLLKPLPD